MTETLRDELAAALRNLSKRCQEELADPEDVGELMRAYVVLAKHDAATLSNASVSDSVCDASAGAGEGWRPIETAPKDGTAILATHIRNLIGSMYVCWRATHDACCPDAEPGQYKIAGTIDECFKPTHWQPLPAAPSQPHGKEGK